MMNWSAGLGAGHGFGHCGGIDDGVRWSHLPFCDVIISALTMGILPFARYARSARYARYVTFILLCDHIVTTIDEVCSCPHEGMNWYEFAISGMVFVTKSPVCMDGMHSICDNTITDQIVTNNNAFWLFMIHLQYHIRISYKKKRRQLNSSPSPKYSPLF